MPDPPGHDSNDAHRRGAWLAAAAVLALAAGSLGFLAMDDHTSVDTGPASALDASTPTMFDSGSCRFGVSGDPITLTPGPVDPPLFDPAGQPDGQAIAHASLGSQVAEIHVPGLVLVDLIGERVEDIELRRGTAQAWFGTAFVQVRWFTGSQEPCDSFTVTVAGGTEDGNRHAAVDLAERILLPAELRTGAPAPA